MNFTSLTIASLAAELHATLAGSNIIRVDSLSPAGLCLRAKARSQIHSLCLAIQSDFFCPFLCTRPQLSHRESPFVRDLHRLIGRHTIASVGQWQHDRVLRVDLHKVDEIRGVLRRALIFELVPRRQNLIVVDVQSNTILGALRRVTGRMSRYRLVRPGHPYQPPPKPTGLQPQTSSAEEFLQAIRQRPAEQLREALTRCVPYISEHLFDELSSRLNLSTHLSVRDLADIQLLSLWNELSSWAARLAGGPLQPALILDQKSRIQILLPYEPKSIPQAQKRTFTSLSLALETAFYKLKDHWAHEVVRKALRAGLRRALHRSRRALKCAQADLAESRQGDELRRRGEIISANIVRLKKGLSQARLPDPYSSGGETVLIPLDPKLSPAENAQRYFKRSRKAKAGLTKIQARLKELRIRLEQLEDVSQSLELSPRGAKLKEIEALLNRLGVQIPLVSPGERIKKQQSRSRPLTIVLKDGGTILVGRNNRENDRLTHQMANPGDLWFHAQGVPGAHVILRREGRKEELSKRVLEEVASVAAYFSRARHSKMVPVVYTEKRYVRKPRGAKPGVVVIERERSLFVEPKLTPGNSDQKK